MSDKYNYHEFKKIVKDFVGDILVTFPEQIDNLDKRLLLIHNRINTNTTEYSNNYDETSKDNDDDEDQEPEETGEQDSDEMLNTVQEIFEYCYEIYPERFFDILYQNVEMFENEDLNTNFLPGIDFKILWKENISDNTRNNIWKYLQLILFTIITNSNLDPDLINALPNIVAPIKVQKLIPAKPLIIPHISNKAFG